MPDPRENIFTTHYSRTDKSCPSPAVRPLAKIVKKAAYYNDSCYSGPPKPGEPTKVQVNSHTINYDNQCYTGPENLDSEETFAAPDPEETFAAPDPEETLNYAIHEYKSCPYPPGDNPTHPIYQDKSCFMSLQKIKRKLTKRKRIPKEG